MPLHIRAFIVVIIIAIVAFVIMAKPSRQIIADTDFKRLRNLWLVITCTAFLIGNFWLFALFVIVLIVMSSRREPTKPALYWLLLSIIPPALHSIPGFGVVNRLFQLNMPRLLALAILLPVLLTGGKMVERHAKKIALPDIFFGIFIVLVVVLSFRQGTLTVGLRASFVLFLSVFLPYFAFSRRLNNFHDIKYTMFAYLLPMFVFGLLGGFEMIRHWKLYLLPSIAEETSYIGRDGSLRASVTTGGPIVLGYIMMVGIGFLLPLANRYLTRLQSLMAFGALGLGLISSLSRGPWVGTVALLVVYISTGRNAFKKLAGVGFAGILLLPILALTPYWDKFVGLIPFVGTIESGTIDYRERLFEQSWIVINRSPWFGSIDFLNTPEMQSMIQGQGIIDLVNTYIQIALQYGFVGLFLFTGFFGAILLNVRRAYKTLPEDSVEMKQFGRAIFATLFAVLMTIATVSSVSFVPHIYWSLAGLAVAYVNVARNHIAETELTAPTASASASKSPATHQD